MLYNAVLISTVQQCKSVICIHISLPLEPSSRSSQSIELHFYKCSGTSRDLK